MMARSKSQPRQEAIVQASVPAPVALPTVAAETTAPLVQPTCSNCKFWEPAQEKFGKCRRYPPQHVHYQHINGPMVKFPLTASDIWCGEHQPR